MTIVFPHGHKIEWAENKRFKQEIVGEDSRQRRSH